MKLCLLLCIFAGFSSSLLAQDERHFRDLMQEKSATLDNVFLSQKKERSYKWQVPGHFYLFDLDDDGVKEKIEYLKRDAEDWIRIYHKGKIVFSGKLHAKGFDSKVYKISITNLSKTTRVLILHYYEGQNDYINFKGTARLYFLSLENKDYKKMYLARGPEYWDEENKIRDHYHHRFYQLNVKDYNRDGVRDIAVKYGRSSRVYLYKGKGSWLHL